MHSQAVDRNAYSKKKSEALPTVYPTLQSIFWQQLFGLHVPTVHLPQLSSPFRLDFQLVMRFLAVFIFQFRFLISTLEAVPALS